MRFGRGAKITWACIFIVMSLLVAFVIVRFVAPSPSPTLPPEAATVVPTTTEHHPHISELEPADTELVQPSESPSTEPSETPIPKNGDVRGCPKSYGQIDTTDPFCKKQQQNAVYQKHYASNPAFQCNDGRNDGLSAKDIKKFVPCVNSSFRLEISHTNTMTRYQSTSRKVKVFKKKPAVPNARAKGLDWLVWQEFTNTGYAIRTNHSPDLKYFGMYARMGATGEWTRQHDGSELEGGAYYQVVVFWNDPAKPAGDTLLPPSFDWRKVAKH